MVFMCECGNSKHVQMLETNTTYVCNVIWLPYYYDPPILDYDLGKGSRWI